MQGIAHVAGINGHLKEVQVGNHKKAKRHNQVVEWPYPQDPPVVEMPDTNRGFLLLFKEQVSDQKSTQHKKDTHTKGTQVGTVGIGPECGVAEVTFKQFRMVHYHQECCDKAHPI